MTSFAVAAIAPSSPALWGDPGALFYLQYHSVNPHRSSFGVSKEKEERGGPTDWSDKSLCLSKRWLAHLVIFLRGREGFGPPVAEVKRLMQKTKDRSGSHFSRFFLFLRTGKTGAMGG
jgi:hypothetical protein